VTSSSNTWTGRIAILFSIPCLLLAFLPASCARTVERVDIGRHVVLYPGASIVDLSNQAVTLPVSVRNVSPRKLTSLTLEVKSEACYAAVHPGKIDGIIPGDRRIFAVTLTRNPAKPRLRYPLQITLLSPDLPAPAGLDLAVDLALPVDRNWIDVGQVTLVSQGSSRTTYILLAATPLLLVLAWLLWRWSRRRRESPRSRAGGSP
jgi:hypothetical protein